MFDRIGPDVEISEPASNSSGSDDGQVSANVGSGDRRNDDAGGCSGDCSDKGVDGEDCALWYENNHDFYMVTFRTASGYKAPRGRQMPVSPDEFYATF